MRLLVDEEGLEWNHAWGLTTRTFAYTNHTVLPEALEKWSVDLLGHLLPRHLEIIYEINKHFLSEVVKIRPDDGALLNRISLIEESNPKQVRMPHLAIVGSHAVNGVAALHTELLKTTVFRDFHSLFPERFQNKTNGITPRLWLKCANPELADLITEQIGASWVTDLEQLQKLRGKSEDKVFQEAWRTVRRRKKAQFAEWLQQMHGLSVDPQTRFDVQIKRIHEYKRQLLNLLHVLHDYLRLKDNPNLDLTPRTVILAGKAAPGYHMAKEIIRLAIAISQLLEQDARVHEKLRLVFVPNYGVAAAQKLIPAADLSQHISTAGTEASGTSNMKFVLNGAPILGTLDGANIEILAAVGAENGFIFGLTTPEVQEVREGGYNPEETLHRNPELKAALKLLVKGKLASGKGEGFRDLHDSLVFSDHYLLLADFASYAECHERVESAWHDPERWTRMSIQNTAGAGSFSSDRTIRQYAEEIWNLRAVPVKSPV
jgi:starch phosphorylase